MQKEEFYYDSRDGVTKIHAVRYIPDGPVRGVFQIIHGMAEYAERYEPFAEFLTQKGFVVTANDHLGHGKSLAEGNPLGYFCKRDPATVVVRDVHRLKKMTQELYPEVPYVILGHSMGSFIMRNYQFRYGSGISASIVMGTGMQPKPLIAVSKVMAAVSGAVLGSKHRAKLIDKIAFGTYNNKIENPRTAYDWLSAEPGNVDRYIADELCGVTFTANGFATLFELINRLLNRDNIAKVPANLPILVISGEEDPVGNYGEGPRQTAECLKAAGVKDVTLSLYPGDRHEILNEADRNEVMEEIFRWMEEKVL